jgi:hypothetical protein
VELLIAPRRGIPVIPVRVMNARMPLESALPMRLKPLADKQGARPP